MVGLLICSLLSILYNYYLKKKKIETELEIFLKNNIIAYVSARKYIIYYRGEQILNKESPQDNIYIVVIDRKKLKIKDFRMFNLIKNCDRDELIQSVCKEGGTETLMEYIKKLKKEIILILIRGEVFGCIKKNKELKRILIKLGMRWRNFTERSNYILLGSCVRDIHYEIESEKPVYFPFFTIVEAECRKNPTTIYPLKKNIFFDDVVFEDDRITRCALESIKEGVRSFGLTGNKCVPITEKKWKQVYMGMPVGRCKLDNKNHEGMRGYRIRLSSGTSEDGVRIIIKGSHHILGEGYYEEKEIIRVEKMDIPEEYIVNIYTIKKGGMERKTETHVGPTEILLKYPRKMMIQKRRRNSTVFCDADEKGRCYVLNPGRHIIPPFMYIKVTNIELGQGIKKVYLYGDTSFLSIIDVIKEKEGILRRRLIKMTSPKVVRSVEII